MPTKASKVQFSQENGMKCICAKCLVQAKSQCSKDKIALVKRLMVEKKMPKPSDVAGLYCASGKASCEDLNFKDGCICGNCPVFKQHVLVAANPVGYYCRDGMSN
jgi:hypothetical protein